MSKYVITAVVIAVFALPAGAGATAPAGHWCPQGDPPLYASADTPCTLAGNVITDYVNVCHEASSCQMWVDSAAPEIRYEITCNRHGGRYTGMVFCKGPADTGIWTRFSDLI